MSFASRATQDTRTVHVLRPAEFADWKADDADRARAWLAGLGFEARDGEIGVWPGADGAPAGAVLITEASEGPWSFAGLPARLPPGRWQLTGLRSGAEAESAALGWGLAGYRFDRYKSKKKPDAPRPVLVWPTGVDGARVTRLVEAIGLARDLINTPAGDLGPAELAAEARRLARRHGARCTVISGKDLLTKGYPAVHAVGRAASREPRLVDLRWGSPSAPKLTLVGKGVCFDSGGLDLKTSAGMLLMKKDMGGAAIVLGLAHAIMDAKLPVRLRVLIPAVENAVSGDAFRPLDVLPTRKGLTVEVGNTDAEGRLILCDALAEADRESPALLMDFATLTGAARVALGTDVPALFSNDEALAEQVLAAGRDVSDELWRMPLWRGYRRQLDSKVADISNVSSGSYGGAITAALFLAEFVSPATPWTHVDVMAWNLESRPGRPSGGEAMGLRAFFHALERRFPPVVSSRRKRR